MISKKILESLSDPSISCKLSEVRNLIGLINEVYILNILLNNTPKRQQLFELTLKEYLPENSHSKLPGLCKTRWVERHTYLDVSLEMYEPLVTILDAVIFPHEYPNLKSYTGSWNWDKDTITKSPGTESLFVVIPDRSGFHYDQEYS